MPLVEFDTLPAAGRVWVFASDRALAGSDARALLDEVDAFLHQWKAHGAPLRSARVWRDDHFLVVGVDPTVEQASGCSIDGLFRGLQALERQLGATLVAGGRVFYRSRDGTVRTARRADVASLAGRGELHDDTTVFDTSLTSAGEYRTRFELPARSSWLAPLLRDRHASQASSRSATNSSSARNG